MRILLSEGSSTSAREAVTVLGIAGHEVEACDPNPRCLARFSRFLGKFHRCPPMGSDPMGFLDFIVDLVSRRGYDVLVPIHEQGYLFARFVDRLRPHVAIALPSFASYEQVIGKAGFSRLLAELSLPQPATRIVAAADVAKAASRHPVVLKSDIGTASRGVWIARDAKALDLALLDIGREEDLQSPIVVQDFVEGEVAHAQAVFDGGRLIGCHAYRQLVRGAGGGDALKESIARDEARAALALMGKRLQWHGALSLDFILERSSGRALYIDCNPRLVEPMSAFLAGLDLMGLLLDVSLGRSPKPLPPSRAGVRTHLAMQALLGAAHAGAGRVELLAECGRLLARRGTYAESVEELTPVRLDWPSALPAAVTAAWLLADPAAAGYLPRRGWGAHLLTPRAMRTIRDLDQSLPSP